MPKEKFVLVSLKEDKAKQLAQIIANESCRKILDYLAEKEATETELAEKLNIPISTVHYNLKHLIEGGLITAEEFHYSEKGKEVNHYKLANKYIIIAPKTTFGIKEKLKTVLPVALLIGAGAGFIQLFSKYIARPGIKTFTATKEAAISEAERFAGDAAKEAAPLAARPETIQDVADVTTTAIPASPLANIALWFLIGGVFAMVLYLIVSKIRER